MDWKPKPVEELWELISKSDSPSLMKAVLTEELFHEFKDEKTSFGGTLAHCISSGCLHFRKNAGIYACDPEAYTVFAKIFTQVIKRYHKVNSICHPEPYFGSEEETQALENIDPEGNMIISTRVRVGRSHAEYPFIPVCSLKNLLDMESETACALNSLTGDLAGKYYPLSDLDKATKERLIVEHYLYRDNNETLRDAGLYKFWDKGRGIFFNKAKTFICWVNEEDHIRLISMEKGSDLASVYSRLVKAISEMERRLTFAKKEGYGYLTFCSTNLGTSIRASVLMAIPHVCKQPNFLEVLDQYNIQPRGTLGSGTANESDIYDLSNKRRLGLTEYDAVKEMLHGVRAIKEWEEQLAGGKTN